MEEVSEEMLPTRGSGRSPTATIRSAVVDAANRAYLVAYRRNARLMALMEQVGADRSEDFRRLRLRRARVPLGNATRRRSRACRGAASPIRRLDPRLAAHALSGMVSRMAYLRYVLGFGKASPETLARTLTRLWVNALGITKEGKEMT